MNKIKEKVYCKNCLHFKITLIFRKLYNSERIGTDLPDQQGFVEKEISICNIYKNSPYTVCENPEDSFFMKNINYNCKNYKI